MAEQHEGGCRCGRVRFRAEGPPMVTMACHCDGCRRMTAGAFSLSALYAADAFTVIAGETVAGGTRVSLDHRFCPDCLSWMFTRFETGMVNVRSALFDDAAAFAPFIDCCASNRLPWTQTGAVHAFAEFPGPAEHPALMAEYAGWRDQLQGDQTQR